MKALQTWITLLFIRCLSLSYSDNFNLTTEKGVWSFKTFVFNIDYFCSDSGDLYTFGESDGGKLGLGDDPDDTDMPQKVLIPEKVKSVACGGTHTVALTGIYT